MREHDDLTNVLPGIAVSDRRVERDRRRRRARRQGTRTLILLLALAVVGGGAYLAYSALRPTIDSLTASKDYAGAGSGSVQVTIADGASGRAIGRVLADADVVKTPGAFVSAAAADPRSGSIQPGTYSLRRQMSGQAAVGLLLDPTSRTAERVTVREGLRATEIVALLAKATGRPTADYVKALKKPEALGVPALAKGRAEGWLFPASYEFEPTATATEQLTMMVSQTKKVLAAAGVSERDSQRLLTIASIAEVEAATPTDYAKVARTLDTRLRIKMKLQLDSTVSYAVGKRTITTTDAERARKSPYNTYVVTGLPLGPISNPGRAAIDGAVKPATGPWLFFVTVDPTTGETKFATTAAEHARNVAQFQLWCRNNAGQC